MCIPAGSKLNRMLPEKSVGLCGTTASRERRTCIGRRCISTPSIFIQPLNPTILLNANNIVLFPAPVLPTKPTTSPGYTVKDTPFSAGMPPALHAHAQHRHIHIYLHIYYVYIYYVYMCKTLEKDTAQHPVQPPPPCGVLRGTDSHFKPSPSCCSALIHLLEGRRCALAISNQKG